MNPSILVVALFAMGSASLQAQTSNTGTLGFYRSPDIRGETVVFAAEGDLWSVPITGGLARRLTSHAAQETSLVISPDGRTLAFTARYEGHTALYTMPLTGGAPIAYLQEKIAEDPRPVPKAPAYPKRAFKYPPN